MNYSSLLINILLLYGIQYVAHIHAASLSSGYFISVTGCLPDGAGTGECPPDTQIKFTFRTRGLRASGSPTYPCGASPSQSPLCVETFGFQSMNDRSLLGNCTGFPKYIDVNPPTKDLNYYVFIEEYTCIMTESTRAWANNTFRVIINITSEHYLVNPAVPFPTTLLVAAYSDDRDIFVHYAQYPSITSVTGCGLNCPTEGNATLTINGVGFLGDRLAVFFGNRRISNSFEGFGDNILLVRDYNGLNAAVSETIRVVRTVTYISNLSTTITSYLNSTATSFLINFQPKPSIQALSGCVLDTSRALTVQYCPIGATVTVSGLNFAVNSGAPASTCLFTDPRAGITYSVPPVSATGTSMVCAAPTAIELGSVAQLKVRINGEKSNETVTLWMSPPCPTDCGPGGKCNPLNGECVCMYSEADGFWVLNPITSICNTCDNNYYGSTCQGKCACTAPTANCDSGYYGSGKCSSCRPGYGGDGCLFKCPSESINGTEVYCGGASQGRCNDGVEGDALCRCQEGYQTPTCVGCAAGYYGRTCRRCPVNATTFEVCSGQGSCSDGLSGTGVCLCLPGYIGTACETFVAACPLPTQYGSLCTFTCPGSISSTTACSGHGVCDSGKLGSGLCNCSSLPNGTRYGGSACAFVCPCAAGAPCDSLGNCLCPTGSITVKDRSCKPCPAVSGNVCGNRGTCVPHATDNIAVCDCIPGYMGAACDATCPAQYGGIQNPCNRHGICSASGCTCFQDPILGFWTGTMCTECSPTYLITSSCRQACSISDGLVCAGHGVCSLSGSCECYGDDKIGFWGQRSNEAPCSSCKLGYWGSSCTQECPGGACWACFGHGKCSDGVRGTGVCTCDRNFQGPLCFNCVSGYYGAQCQLSCRVACGGHGKCNDGISGDGLCVCQNDFAGPTCQECRTGYALIGGKCTACPGDPIPCLGRGTCVPSSTGPTCQCSGFTGTDCSVPCPLYNGVSCNGMPCVLSSTVPRFGVCQCERGTEHMAGFACERCSEGYYGARCNGICPGGVVTPCSLVGVCERNGTCTCNAGYSGSRCNIVCPRNNFGEVCSGHGSCDSNGRCTCVRNSREGFWAGTDCSSCAYSYYLNSNCTLRCPYNNESNSYCGNGTCSAEGTCVECGMIDGLVSRCGEACELSGLICYDISCPQPYLYGQKCDKVCPGKLSEEVVCSGHGECFAGRLANGTCSCTKPWSSRDCSVKCDACSSHGICNVNTGFCQCYEGYASRLCDVKCPTGTNGLECSGSQQGKCRSGYTGDGTCECAYGFTGTMCQLKCPCFGRSAEDCRVNPCSGHGICGTLDDITSICTCTTDSKRGFFTGVNCETCIFPYELPACLSYCPGLRLDSGVKCNGHGRCLSDTLTCECFSDLKLGYWTGRACDQCQYGFYGAKCTLQCPGGSCTPCNGHGNCSMGTTGSGMCTCTAQASTGFWSGESCNQCQRGFYGRSCSNLCPKDDNDNTCSGRGKCDDGVTGSGACLCTDTERGHWAGYSCDTCKADPLLGTYYGPTCTSECPKDPLFSSFCSKIDSEANCTAQVTCGWSSSQLMCEQRYCSGHGTCISGVTLPKGAVAPLGTCDCRCDTLQDSNDRCDMYVGQYCQYKCPVNVESGLKCSGHGTCKLFGVRALCDCDANFQGSLCNVCTSGKWGSECDKECDAGYGSAKATCTAQTNPTDCRHNCSSRHIYGAGCNRDDGSCSCIQGFAGARCENECKPSKSNVCNGHGRCITNLESSNIGGCECYSDCTNGFWDPETFCGTCLPGFAAPDCRQACPTTYDGAICGGYGQCFQTNITTVNTDTQLSNTSCPQAVCLGCSVGRCNGPRKACDASGKASCDGLICDDPAAYGPKCDMLCPMTNKTVCNNQGLCDNGRTGVGTCLCYATSKYVGFGCEQRCPECVHGSCVAGETKAECQCSFGWGGFLCEVPCPGGASYPCTSPSAFNLDCTLQSTASSCATLTGCQWFSAEKQCASASARGVCTMSSRVPAPTCSCLPIYAGPMCTLECPGIIGTKPCTTHGTCSSPDGATAVCRCDDTDTLGHWFGDDCSECNAGWAGNDCKERCPSTNGDSGPGFGRKCVCKKFRFGPSCATLCPGYNETSATVCSTHGQCEDGWKASGLCKCFSLLGTVDNDPAYFREDCSVFCSVNRTCAGMNQKQTTCSNNGTCVCVRDKKLGFWGGKSCSTCYDGYWGTQCTRQCNCNGHGTCQRSNGRCTCFSDAIRGFWESALLTACSRCQEKYIGAQCTQPDARVSIKGYVVPPNSAPQDDPTRSIHIVDVLYNRVFMGGRPLYVMYSVPNSETLQEDPVQTTMQTYIGNARVVSGVLKDDVLELFIENELGETNLVIFDRRSLNPLTVTKLSHHHTFQVLQNTTNNNKTFTNATNITTASIPVTSNSLKMSFQHNEWSYVLQQNGVMIVMQSATIVTKVDWATTYFGVGRAPQSLLVTEGGHLLVLGSTANSTTGGNWDIYVIYDIESALVNMTSTTKLSAVSIKKRLVVDACLVGGQDTCVKTWYASDSGNNTLVCMWESSRGSTSRELVIGRFDLAELQRNNRTSVLKVFSATIPGAGQSYPTALAADTFTNVVYAAMNERNSKGVDNPTVLYKIKVSTLELFGSARFSVFQGQPEVVTSLELKPLDRTLSAKIATSTPAVVELMLCDIQDVQPKVVAKRGGTPLTIFGEGFVKVGSNRVMCSFCRGCDTVAPSIEEYPAVSVTPTEIVCTIPPDKALSAQEQLALYPPGSDKTTTSARDPGCLQTLVEISLFDGRRYTKNQIGINRVALPEAQWASPGEGPATIQQIVTVHGIGFLNTTRIMCALVSSLNSIVVGRMSPTATTPVVGQLTPEDPTGVVYFTTTQATFIDGTQVLCLRPPLREATSYAERPTFLTVSFDGWVFGKSSAMYNATGNPTSIVVVPPIVTIVADAIVLLPPVRVYVADETGHFLSGLGEFTITYNVPAPLTDVGFSNTAKYLNGSVALTNVALVKPKVSPNTIAGWQITLSRIGEPWRGSVVVKVIEGPFAMISINPGHASQTDNIRVMDPGPIVRIQDAAGNDVTSGTTLSCQLFLVPVVTVPKLPRVAQSPEIGTGLVNTKLREGVGFDYGPASVPIRIQAVFGEVYKLVANVTDGRKSLMTESPTLVTAASCPANMFQKVGSILCLSCPTGGICNGKSIIFAQQNYWRSSNTSIDYYQCHYKFKFCNANQRGFNGTAASIQPDNTSFDTFSCMAGYTGPLCSVCVYNDTQKYGRVGEQCGDCPSEALSSFILFVLALAIIVWLGVVISKAINATDKDEMMVLIKMFTNHMQLVSQIGRFKLALPPIVKELFSGTEQASSVNGQVAALECKYPHTYYDRFTVVMILPVIIPAAAFLYSTFSYLRAKFQSPEKVKQAEIDMRKNTLYVDALLQYNKQHREQHVFEKLDIESLPSEPAPPSPKYAPNQWQSFRHFPSPPPPPPGEESNEPFTSSLDSPKQQEQQKGLSRKNLLKLELSARKNNNIVEATQEDIAPQQQPTEPAEPLDPELVKKNALKTKIISQFCIGCITLIFVLYITIVQHASNMMRCDDYVETDYYLRSHAVSYLTIDRRIDCNAEPFPRYFTLATVFLFVYGVGFPLGCVAIVVLLKRFIPEERVNGMFTFMMTGYTAHSWFWETTVL
eukprot:PhF_6_TR15925/c0_g1_i1/m.24680